MKPLKKTFLLLSTLFSIFCLNISALAAYTYDDLVAGTYEMTDDGAYVVDINERTTAVITLYLAVENTDINIPAFRGQYFFEYVREDGTHAQLLYYFQPANRKLVETNLTEDCDIWVYRFYVEPGSFIFSDSYGSIGAGRLPDSYTLKKDYTLQTEDFRDAEDILSWPELVTIDDGGYYNVYALYGSIPWRDKNLDAFSSWVAKKDAADKAAEEGLHGESITVEVESGSESESGVSESNVSGSDSESISDTSTTDSTLETSTEVITMEGEGLSTPEEEVSSEEKTEIPTMEVEEKTEEKNAFPISWLVGGVGVLILLILLRKKKNKQ